MTVISFRLRPNLEFDLVLPQEVECQLLSLQHLAAFLAFAPGAFYVAVLQSRMELKACRFTFRSNEWQPCAIARRLSS